MAISTALGEPKEVRLEQGTVRYRERGSGPTVLFVHGVFVNGDLWRRVVPALGDGVRCVVPDLPLGAHTAPMASGADVTPSGVARMLADFMDALDLDDVTLVGNDTGGALCQLLVAHHPERLGRLVLTNCDAFEHFLPPAGRPIQWVARIPGSVRALGALLRLAPARRAFAATVAHHRPEPDVLESFFGPVARDAGVRADTTRFLQGISNRDTLEAARHFGAFDRPVLVAWGQDDWFFPKTLADRLVAAFPDARLERLSGSRAFVPEDQPEALARLVAGFVPRPAAA